MAGMSQHVMDTAGFLQKNLFSLQELRGENPLLQHRFMEQEASSALASLAYRNSNFFRLMRCQ